jgi:hypothetical protein
MARNHSWFTGSARSATLLDPSASATHALFRVFLRRYTTSAADRGPAMRMALGALDGSAGEPAWVDTEIRRFIPDQRSRGTTVASCRTLGRELQPTGAQPIHDAKGRILTDATYAYATGR